MDEERDGAVGGLEHGVYLVVALADGGIGAGDVLAGESGVGDDLVVGGLAAGVAGTKTR